MAEKLTFLFIICLTFSTVLFAQESHPSLFEISDEPITNWPAKSKADLQKAPIQINSSILNQLQNKDIENFQIQLLDGRSHHADVQRVIKHLNDDWSITAKLDDSLLNSFTLSSSDGKVYGIIKHRDTHQFFEINYDPASQSYTLVKVDPHLSSEFDCEVVHKPEEAFYPGGNEKSKDFPDKIQALEATSTIDLMIVYTTAAKNWAETNVSGGIDNVINQAVANAQLTVDNSQVDINFQLVHSEEVDYEENGDSGLDLRKLTRSPISTILKTVDTYGYLDEVHYLRKKFGADLVALLTESGDVGGTAWIPTNEGLNDQRGFSLSRVQWAMYSVFIHEIGHNMGNAHSRNQNTAAAGASGGRFDYSTGWRWTGDDSNGYASVMTYTEGDQRVDLFSNPDINYEGVPSGSYTGDFAPADNSRSMNEVRGVVASYRPVGGENFAKISLSDEELFFEIGPGEQISQSITLSNSGVNDLTYDIQSAHSIFFEDFTASDEEFVRLNSDPLTGSISEIIPWYHLVSESGGALGPDLTLLMTNTPDISASTETYQVGGSWRNYDGSWWNDGYYRAQIGQLITNTVSLTSAYAPDNIYLWLGNNTSQEGSQGTWTGRIDVTGISNEASVLNSSITPSSGSILPGNNATVMLEFDATGLPAGEYQESIVISSNDPFRPDIVIPVTIMITEPNLTVEYSKNWNLVGVPVESPGITFDQLFENITQEPFIFESNGYNFTSTFNMHTGYWAHLSNNETVHYSGTLLESVSIDLDEGWNLVSGPGYSVSVDNVSDPQNIINSDWFGFNGSYSSAETVVPGKGYWVRASASGSITLDHQTSKLITNSKPYEFIEDKNLNSLIFTSGTDTLQTLYFGKKVPETIESERFAMPPLPPVEAFDVRFEGEESWLSEKLNPSINIQSGNKEIGVLFRASDGHSVNNWELVQLTNDEVIDRSMIQEGDQLRLQSENINRLQLIQGVQQVAEKSDIPGSFMLEQNYPNPFNPTTTIRFSLPQQSRVEIAVYNIVGRQVGTVVNGVMEAGNHTATFDASSLTSGVYFYEMRAGSFREIKKLTVIK